jgi:ankyrin repeat protein
MMAAAGVTFSEEEVEEAAKLLASNKFALHAAARAGDLVQVRLLIAAAGNVNAQSWNDNTPLHDATENGREAVVRELLEAGADTEAQNELLFTPLHMAASLGLNPKP